MLRNKRLVKFISLSLIMLLTLGVLTGCGAENKEKGNTNNGVEGYEQPIKNMVEGLSEGNSEKFLKAFPSYISDYMMTMFTDDYLKSAVKTAEEEYGKNITMTYKINDKQEISENELKEIEQEVKESFNKEIKVTKGYKVSLEITTKGDDSQNTEKDEFKVYEIDGNWYMLAL